MCRLGYLLDLHWFNKTSIMWSWTYTLFGISFKTKSYSFNILPATKQVADILTKPLSATTFNQLKFKFNVRDVIDLQGR